ncbi:putative C-8 sterol isomerase [Trypanosoma vivax]|uniref:Putative C-8 sterol isomerase n=1 Tax=Trypanosoma vivax (strain Y486) TaxID=1055687 RepID=G0TTE3_TRYVY|nr:putative C-8 sterol isomerase [Trypanosoma vivax]CCC47224.1 putative C-8 sterol isomerase [Trypanosoma vivax Y486]
MPSGVMYKFFLKVFSLAVLLVVFSAVIDRPENWVFDPKKLQEIAKRGIAHAQNKHGLNATAHEVISAVVSHVLQEYPAYTQNTGHWILNNAGGAMGSMTVLHSSLSEYLIVFGTAVGTEGHTGRYPWAEDYFTIIYGEQWAALPSATSAEVYRPGDQHFLPRRVAKQYRMPGPCFALEYARGNIPSMLLFGFADLFTSTLDFVTFYDTVMGSAGQMIQNALRWKI